MPKEILQSSWYVLCNAIVYVECISIEQLISILFSIKIPRVMPSALKDSNQNRAVEHSQGKKNTEITAM